MPVSRDFTVVDVIPHIGANTRKVAAGVSAALSWLHRTTGNLKVVDKRGSYYVYRLVSLEPPTFSGAKPHSEHGPRNVKKGTRHVLKKSDFGTGRLTQPDLSIQQRAPAPIDLTGIDFASIEQRVMAHYLNQPSLADYTDTELLTELLRRRKDD